MAGPSLLCESLGMNAKNLTRAELFIVEAELFLQLCEEVETKFKNQYKEYFRLMKFNVDRETEMIESSFIRCLLNDILVTESYTLPGIAFYTQAPEEVICDLISGCNASPSLLLTRKIIELHRAVRPDLYIEVMKKIMNVALLPAQKNCA